MFDKKRRSVKFVSDDEAVSLGVQLTFDFYFMEVPDEKETRISQKKKKVLNGLR